MAQYVSNGHVCKIDHEDDKADTIRYLPHDAVIREDKVTTKSLMEAVKHPMVFRLIPVF